MAPCPQRLPPTESHLQVQLSLSDQMLLYKDSPVAAGHMEEGRKEGTAKPVQPGEPGETWHWLQCKGSVVRIVRDRSAHSGPWCHGARPHAVPLLSLQHSLHTRGHRLRCAGATPLPPAREEPGHRGLPPEPAAAHVGVAQLPPVSGVPPRPRGCYGEGPGGTFCRGPITGAGGPW